jgi:Zn-dependent protease
MNALNAFMSLSVPAGRIAGISIRIHILFIIYVCFQVWDLRNQGTVFALALFAGVYVCILLHEFGHAFSARWCGGQADEILIWPLGGLAYCQPPLNPTPHLITTLGGPMVTLILWGILTVIAGALQPDSFHGVSESRVWAWDYFSALAHQNLVLLLFNLVPAFPLDGGRALRDTLWHWIPIQKANRIAGVVGIIACIGLISWGISHSNQWMVFIGIYAIFGSAQEMASQAYIELWQLEHWSLRDRLGMRERMASGHRMPRRKHRASSPNPLPYEPKIVPRPDISDDPVPVAKIDAILEKIARSGMESLTADERRQLERASKELKRQDG